MLQLYQNVYMAKRLDNTEWADGVGEVNGQRWRRNLLASRFLAILVVFLVFSPETLDGFEDAITTEVEVEEAKDGEGSEQIEKHVGAGHIRRRHVVLHNVMATIPGMEGDDEAQNEINRQVQNGGGEHQTSREGGGHDPGSSLECLQLHILG